MIITIDVSQIIYGTGVSAYTENLVKSLLALDQANRYILFGGSLRRLGELKAKAGRLGPNSTVKAFPIPPTLADMLWNRLHIFSIENLVGKCDVFHSSDWSQPPASAFCVTTVHDLAPIKFPRFSHPTTVEVHRRRLRRVQAEVDRIIVPSLSTMTDLIELGFEKEKIRVIPEAVEAGFGQADEGKINEVKAKYNIRDKYLFAVGVGWRKNTEKIIRAYEQAKVKKDLKLVIAGRGGKNDGWERGANFIGHVPPVDLAALYAGAEALVYPSLYEGFGLPILQAMASGCPVVTSNISSMPEVAGEAGVLVDPYDVSSISEGIKLALKDKRRLASLGRRRAKEFSWEKTAGETLKVYEESGGKLS